MIVEYRCSCGFKTIFPNKYVRHTNSCTDRPQPEKEQRIFGQIPQPQPQVRTCGSWRGLFRCTASSEQISSGKMGAEDV